jgi:hypothetical protein
LSKSRFGTCLYRLNPNEAAIQACINNILSLVVFDEAELAGLVELMVDFSLDSLYSVPAT